MNIVFCLNQFLDTHIGGTEIYVEKLSKKMIEFGHSVSILLPAFSFFNIENSPKIINELPVFFYVENSLPDDKEIFVGAKVNNGIKDFESVLLKLKPDIVHFHELTRGFGFSVWHVIAAKKLNFKTILTLHQPYLTCSNNILKFRNLDCDGLIVKNKCLECVFNSKYDFSYRSSKILRIFSLFLKNIYFLFPKSSKIHTLSIFPLYIKRIYSDIKYINEFCDCIVFLNSWFKNIAVSNGITQKKSMIIETAQFKISDNLKKYSFKEISLVYIGRIEKIKGLNTLIKAVSFFSKNQITLNIYGPHSRYLNELLPTISKLDNVFYHGSINQVDVDTILSKHNFFINPSEFGEMSPLSLIDALRVGLIPIVSNAPGNLNYIKNDINGFVFEMGNLSNLVCVLDKIRHLIKNNQLFLHESYFQDYRFSDYNKLYLKVIE